MEILLDGWLMADLLLFSTEGLGVMSNVYVPQCQNKLWK